MLLHLSLSSGAIQYFRKLLPRLNSYTLSGTT